MRALAADGKLLAAYPASIGSEEKPAPSGTLKVVRVAHGPTYTYNPEFKFRGVKADGKLQDRGRAEQSGRLGVDRARPEDLRHPRHAEPAKVGKVDSHGCVRMTNWDALALAEMVRKGTPVEFID